jgi:hypothetical protein
LLDSIATKRQINLSNRDTKKETQQKRKSGRKKNMWVS